jgi:penicillin-binding protein 1A
VFVGFDTPEALGESEQGATVAVPIWIDYMKQALEGRPENTMSRPDGLVDRLIDRESGEIARPGQAGTMFEVFMAESAPAELRNQQQPRTPDRDNQNTLSTEIIF